MTRRVRILTLFVSALALPIVVSSCGNNPAGRGLPELVGATALSRHYIGVTFTQPMGEEAERADAYIITAPDSSQLRVRAASLSPDRTQVLLTTDAQREVVEYTLSFDGIFSLDSVSTVLAPSGAPEPELETAISLDTNTVLLTMSERMDRPSTEAVEFYRIFAANAETPREDVSDLDITNAVLEDSTITVLLTTSDQTNIEYTVKMTNATRGPGPFLINPDFNTKTFFGIRPDDFVPPRLVKAEATSSTSVLLTFSEPLRDESDALSEPRRDESNDAGNFSISPSLVVTDAELTNHKTQILLTTLTQVPDRPYTVTVANVKDIAGNVIKAGTVCIDNGNDCTPSNNDCNPNVDCVNSDTAGLRGSSRELFVHSALALNNTQLLLTFSEPMDPATTACATRETCRAIYSIADPDGDIDVDIIVESAIPDVGEGDRTVVLNTTSQENILYTLTVRNVKAIRDDFLLDPTRNMATFFGIPTEDSQGPNVLSAVATNNTSVLVSFSEPLGGTGILDSAPDGQPEDPSNFKITSSSCTKDHCGSGAVQGERCGDDSDCPLALKPCIENVCAGGLRNGQACDEDLLCPVDNQVATCLLATSANCQELIVEDGQLTIHDTQVLLTTLAQVINVKYTATVSSVKDKSGNDLVAPDSGDFKGVPRTDRGPPRVIGAISTSNLTVVVTFSKRMGPSAANPANYFIVQENVQPEAGALVIVSARFVNEELGDAVQLTTLPQSEVTYRVTAVNVLDALGNQLAAQELLVDPTSTLFAGTPFGCPSLRHCANGARGLNGSGACDTDNDCDDDPPCGPTEEDCKDQCVQPAEGCTEPDADGDGLSDNEEQRGWVVRVTFTDGTVAERDVTSDPFVADTDGDGLDDRVEKLLSIDPRDSDTDDDLVSDFDERTLHFTSPANQDTDGDGLGDFGELDFFKTSPLLADTDGDGFTDAEEVFELNRDPRVADVPQPRIQIGDIALRLDTRFSFTDQQGVSRTSEESVSTTLEKSQETSFSFSDTSTTTNAVETEVAVKAEFGSSFNFKGAEISGKVGYSFTQENQTQVTQESKKAAQETYNRSLTTSQTVDEIQAVTREVIGASIDVALTIANIGDIAFTMTNLEVTALLQDPVDRSRFLPVATLVPATQLITGEIPSITAGVFVPERGPFIFTSRDVFPTLVEDLMRSPRGLIFKVANFDVLDEFGRNFAFVEQSINERTAGLTIDFGNSRVERFRVATYNSFEDILRACDSGSTLQGQECSSDADCRDTCDLTGACTNGTCSNNIDLPCNDDAECHLCKGDLTTPCTAVSDCGTEGRCARALCNDSAGPLEGRACRIDADCSGGRCDETLLDSIFSGSFDENGKSRGIRLKSALQEILGFDENTSLDAITVGPNGCGETWASGDDIQAFDPICFDVIRADRLIILPGPNGVLNSVPRGDDIDAEIDVGDCSSNPDLKCTEDGDCGGHKCTTVVGSCVPALCRLSICVGGVTSGAPCTIDADCIRCAGASSLLCTIDDDCNKSCSGGPNDGAACSADSQCPAVCENKRPQPVILDGGDGCAQSSPVRDDLAAILLANNQEQVQQTGCTFGGLDGEIILAGPNGVLDTQIAFGPEGQCGKGTCGTCETNSTNSDRCVGGQQAGEACQEDADCQFCSNGDCKMCMDDSDCWLCSNDRTRTCTLNNGDCIPVQLDDQKTTITGYGTEIIGVCSGDSDNPGEDCDRDADCPNGACKQLQVLTRINGIEDEFVFRCNPDSEPERIGRICVRNSCISIDDQCGKNGDCIQVRDRFWFVQASSDQALGVDFDEIRLRPGDRITLAYVQDADGDGLLRREEFLYGSSDLPPRGVNSDGCPILGSRAFSGCLGLTFDSIRDFDEVRRGWEIKVVGPPSYFAFSDPTLPDTDLDGLFDDQEQTQGTDPTKRDTDEDGISDFDEINGYVVFDRDRLPAGQVPAYIREVILDGGLGNGGIGIVDTEPAGDDKLAGRCGNNGKACEFNDDCAGGGTCTALVRGGLVGGRCRGGSDNVIRAGADGIANTVVRIRSDDIQVVDFGKSAKLDECTLGLFCRSTGQTCISDDGCPGGIVIEPGPNGIIDSVPGDALGNGIVDDIDADDHFGTNVLCVDSSSFECQTDVCGSSGQCDLNKNIPCANDNDCHGVCKDLPGGVIILPGVNGRINTVPAGDDFIAQFHERLFATDPLNRDTDGDTLFDGVEAALAFLGANPNDPTDADEFRDDDRDGLVNKEERTGWVPVFVVSASTGNTCSTNKLCVGGGRAGLPCEKHVECKFKSICRTAFGVPVDVPFPDNTCDSDSGDDIGKACKRDSDCGSGKCIKSLRCVNNSDPIDPNIGKFCEQDSDCAGGDCLDLLTQVEECVVLSDTFEPDSDFDGLSDLLEKLINTNPKDPDTDGDNLLDSDELDPRSRFSVDPSLFRLFENKCLEATRCVSFDTDASQAFGTSLKAVDTDGDGRNDLEELFVSWTINVVGQDSYRVFSDPLEADFDADGLNDFEEQNADKPTDPTKADTDNDSVSDFRETEPGGPNTNPLEADQKILVNIASITVIGNCDDNDIGEFRGKIFVQASGVDQQELHSFGDMREGAVINPPAVIPFTIREGDTIIVFSNAIREEDSNPDEQLGSFQEFFNFPISGQLKAVELTDGEDSCKLLIVIQLRWIR